MKIYSAAALLLVGSVCGSMAGAFYGEGIRAHFRTQVVHAQEQWPPYAACTSGVPKEWGDFMGASAYGLAFQDDKGTLRFIKNPVCGSSILSSAPVSSADLQIQRK